MRHRVYGKHFGRNKDERDNLFKGLVQALLIHGTIQTSEIRAKAIKGLVDKVINLAKEKREEQLQSIVTDKNLRDRLKDDILPKLGARTSGYTKVIRVGARVGDQTTMVRMSLIGTEGLKPFKREVKEVKKAKESKIEETAPAKKELTKKASSRETVVTSRRQNKKRVSK